MIVSAFPATGKTWASKHRDDAVDSDSSAFSWKWLGPEVCERHPDWPQNYLRHIKELQRDRLVLVSTHEEVRTLLASEELPFMLVYPDISCVAEYVDRLRRRGSPQRLITAMADNWYDWLRSCRAQRGCTHIVLTRGQHLGDVLDGIIPSIHHG